MKKKSKEKHTYFYECRKCQAYFTKTQEGSNYFPSKICQKCPRCKRMGGLELIHEAPFCIVKNTSNMTVGAYAERNSQKAGRAFVEDNEQKQQEEFDKRIEKLNQDRPHPFGRRMLKKERGKDIWWRDPKKEVDLSLNRMTKEEKKHYILKGEKPSHLKGKNK
jgi:hypothetical protein